MKKFKYFIFVLLAITATIAFAAATDKYFQSTGNIILDPGSSGNVQIKKELRTDKITNLAGTSGAPGMVPLGGMVAVMPTTHANLWQPPATGVIKDGFMRADGHVITAQNVTDGSIIPAGTTLPSMIQKYPRGNTTSGTSSGSNTQASNVAVATQPAINAHSFTQPSAHVITQPAINAHSFTQPSAHGITQPVFNVPSHYHNSFSLNAAGQGGGSHSHTFQGFTGQCWSGGSGCNHTKMQDDGGTVSRLSSDAHTHSPSAVSGTVGNQGGSNGDAAFAASRATDVALSNNHSGGGVDGHSLSQSVALTNNHSGGGVDGHSLSQNVTLTNNAVNNEPSYVEVVWVIRVK